QDEEEQKEHDVALEPDRFEELTIHFRPGLRENGRLEKLVDGILYRACAVRIVGANGNAVERIAEIVKFLPDVERHEEELGVVLITAGLENPGDGKFLRQNNVAQFVERLLFVVPLCVLQAFNPVENLAEISRRVNGELVADVHPQNAREIAAEHG